MHRYIVKHLAVLPQFKLNLKKGILSLHGPFYILSYLPVRKIRWSLILNARIMHNAQSWIKKTLSGTQIVKLTNVITSASARKVHALTATIQQTRLSRTN